MILDLHGKSPDTRLFGEAFRDSLAFEYTIPLQTQVLMKAPSAVLLDDKALT